MASRRCDRCGATCADEEQWWLLEDCSVICVDCGQEFDEEDLYSPDEEHPIDSETWWEEISGTSEES